MATLTVRKGIDTARKLGPDGQTQILLIGRQGAMKAARNGTVWSEAVSAKLSPLVDEQMLKQDMEKFDKSAGSMPLYLDLAKVVVVSDNPHSSPANGYEITREVASTDVARGVKCLNVVLFTDYATTMASAVAVARCFPLHLATRRNDGNELSEVQVELVLTDQTRLSDSELAFLCRLIDDVRFAARITDLPAPSLHTTDFLKEARSRVREIGVATEFKQIEGVNLEKYGGIYSVGHVATHPPSLVCFSYTPPPPIIAIETFALIGKGLVYGTAGSNTKSMGGRIGLKHDMGGAGTVLGAFCALIKGGFRQNLHCVICLGESFFSPDESRSDDVVTMLSGKTVEVTNVCREALERLMLGDGVVYAKKELKANTIINLATLTAQQRVSTGIYHAGIVTNSDQLKTECVQAGRKSGELVHVLPCLPNLHSGGLSSKVADMKNANPDSEAGPPSSVTGLFVASQFLDMNKPQGTEGDRWLQIDISANAKFKTLNDRGSGFGTALIVSLLGHHTDHVPLTKW